jgi:hypothetical protein
MPARNVIPDGRCALLSALAATDSRSDASVLARLGLILFSRAQDAQRAHCETETVLEELCAAARAVVVTDDASTASVRLLREVLAKHGWLPPADAALPGVLQSSHHDV